MVKSPYVIFYFSSMSDVIVDSKHILLHSQSRFGETNILDIFSTENNSVTNLTTTLASKMMELALNQLCKRYIYFHLCSLVMHLYM